ncbi:hypothetical protein A5886_000400 [Enterococcus sp. 8G7_MSG3316]|uniref:Isochorismatase-like domain-containing protein n=1 Tax=Candidatus Enterococcus testudinis TaxID=1834191 RepID=A0A242A359_9ENTE|nr:cysteine hydrolase family protein [Enterococcus sp. 8G7_MSG3316]OTN75330.1 hypothetical protein A5886_000400 [Enterococcus sp. 8G7_MSG3316]
MEDVFVVIDLQNGVCNENGTTIDHLDRLLDFVNQRIDRYRAAARPIIFVQHEDEELVYGTTAWQLHPQLHHEPTDIYTRKTHANSFFQTDFAEILHDLGVKRIEFAGAQTEYCMDGTIKFAHGLGFENTVYTQATSTYPSNGLTASAIIEWYEGIWQNRYARVLSQTK